jgi:hypothetical protein
MNNSVDGKDSSKESPTNSKEWFEQDVSNIQLEKYVFR